MSHALRAPLPRIRVTIGLLGGDPRPDLCRAHVDRLGHGAEEGARLGVVPQGDTGTLPGDARLLRRAVRSLLENAHRHGESEIPVRVVCSGGGATIAACGRGLGAPERERGGACSEATIAHPAASSAPG